MYNSNLDQALCELESCLLHDELVDKLGATYYLEKKDIGKFICLWSYLDSLARFDNKYFKINLIKTRQKIENEYNISTEAFNYINSCISLSWR